MYDDSSFCNRKSQKLYFPRNQLTSAKSKFPLVYRTIERMVKTVFRRANWKEPSLSRKRERLELEHRKQFNGSCWWETQFSLILITLNSSVESPIGMTPLWNISTGCLEQSWMAFGTSLLGLGKSTFECSCMPTTTSIISQRFIMQSLLNVFRTFHFI